MSGRLDNWLAGKGLTKPKYSVCCLLVICKYMVCYEIRTSTNKDEYRLHHEVEVGMGFTQPRAEGPRIV